MKNIRLFLLRAVVILLAVAPAAMGPATAQPRASVSYQVFYDDLSPYGQWIADAQYGYVWVPDVDWDFRPYYTNGYWVMTPYGNTWYSDYPWGWAPFHYGRWTYDPYYGWVWIPGYEWAPAWVCWRQGSGYYGWAPLSPGFTITVSFSSYWCPVNWWVFIPPHHIHNRHFHTHTYGPRRNPEIIHRTTIINNSQTNPAGHFRYPSGPGREDIQAVTGKPVALYEMEEQARPGRPAVTKNVVAIYKPDLDRNAAASPAGAIKAPRTIAQPSPVGEGGQRPEFHGTRPASNPVLPSRNPAQQEQPAHREETTRPARRYDDDIYNKNQQQPSAPAPVRSPRSDQPYNEQPPQQRQAKPAERPAQPQRQMPTRAEPQRPVPEQQKQQPERQRPTR